MLGVSELRWEMMNKKVSKRKDVASAKTKVKTYTSKIHVNKEDLERDFYRADLRLLGVDIKVPTYEGRVFINSTRANLDTPTVDTPTDLEHGYVGSYGIFGHSACLGDEGHCDVHTQRLKFDVIPYRLVPEDISITITDKLKSLARQTSDFTITICPIVCPPIEERDMEKVDLKNVVKINKVSIELYDKES
jgi:hypothetical protein